MVALGETTKLGIVDASRKAVNAQEHVLAMRLQHKHKQW
jgi:hypothetical protein